MRLFRRTVEIVDKTFCIWVTTAGIILVGLPSNSSLFTVSYITYLVLVSFWLLGVFFIFVSDSLGTIRCGLLGHTKDASMCPTDSAKLRLQLRDVLNDDSTYNDSWCRRCGENT